MRPPPRVISVISAHSLGLKSVLMGSKLGRLVLSADEVLSEVPISTPACEAGTPRVAESADAG